MNINPEIIDAITAVTRKPIKWYEGKPCRWRFSDQDGNVLRKSARVPYTHASIQSATFVVVKGGSKVRHVFLCFHSTANPKRSYSTYTIERVIPITEAAP